MNEMAKRIGESGDEKLGGKNLLAAVYLREKN
jgi:hypothetical protein